MQALAEVGDMLRGVFRITKMCDEKSRRPAIENRGEGLFPHRKINVRRRSCGHDVRAVGDANPRSVPRECDTVLLIKIRDMVRRVARSINNIKFSRAHEKSFSAFENLNILFGYRMCFAE